MIRLRACAATAALAMVVVAPLCAHMQQAEVLWFGAYDVVGSETEVKDPNTPSGTRLLSEGIVPPRVNSDTIQAAVGVRFGLGYVLHGVVTGAAAPVRHLYTFPPRGLRNPRTGEISYSTTRELTVGTGRPSFMGYPFREDWEMIAGPWTFEVWSGDVLLARKTFTVTR